MKSNSSGPGCGVICNAGGDKFKHLGHFRSSKVLEKGHNQGAPGGGLDLNDPKMNPLSNPNGFAAASGGRPGARVGGNVGAPVAKSAGVGSLAQAGGNMAVAPGYKTPGVGTLAQAPGAAPVNPAGALQGLAKLVGNSAAPRKRSSAGTGGAMRRPNMQSSAKPILTPKSGMNVAKEPGTSTPAGRMNAMPASAGPKAALQGAVDVLRKGRQGVRNVMRGGAKRKNPRM